MGAALKRTRIARRTATVVILLIISISVVSIYFWPDTIKLVNAYDQIFKIVGFGVGPALAILGFVWGLIDKAELTDQAEKLGQAKEAASVAESHAEAAKKEVEEKQKRIASLENDLTSIANSSRLWKLRTNDPFAEYRGWKYDPLGAKVVTFALFKGGVGKTHLVANFAAYISEKQQKPVLLLDLDYQGSLSVIMMLAAGIEPTNSKIDALFDENADLKTLNSAKIHLAGRGTDTALNKGHGLSRAWLVPASYTLAEVESQLLVDRVMKGRSELDERYRLAHLLLHPDVRREFGAIVLDTPPRMTLGTVNAFVASHFYVVPTILDQVSSEAIGPFLAQVERLKHDLDVELRSAGVVPMMTRQAHISDTEERVLQQITSTVVEATNEVADIVIKNNLPRRVQVTNESDLGYFLSDNNGGLKRFYDPVFDKIWQRMHNFA